MSKLSQKELELIVALIVTHEHLQWVVGNFLQMSKELSNLAENFAPMLDEYLNNQIKSEGYTREDLQAIYARLVAQPQSDSDKSEADPYEAEQQEFSF